MKRTSNHICQKWWFCWSNILKEATLRGPLPCIFTWITFWSRWFHTRSCEGVKAWSTHCRGGGGLSPPILTALMNHTHSKVTEHFARQLRPSFSYFVPCQVRSNCSLETAGVGAQITRSAGHIKWSLNPRNTLYPMFTIQVSWTSLDE